MKITGRLVLEWAVASHSRYGYSFYASSILLAQWKVWQMLCQGCAFVIVPLLVFELLLRNCSDVGVYVAFSAPGSFSCDTVSAVIFAYRVLINYGITGQLVPSILTIALRYIPTFIDFWDPPTSFTQHLLSRPKSDGTITPLGDTVIAFIPINELVEDMVFLIFLGCDNDMHTIWEEDYPI